MSKSHATGWQSDTPTAAQLKEFFAQVECGRITGTRLQALFRDEPEPSNVFVSGPYVIEFSSGSTAIALHLRECGFEGTIDARITDKNYPSDYSGFGLVSRKQTIRLLYFGRNVSTREALTWMKPHSFTPVGPTSILALGTKHPELQRYRIVGLGQFANLKNPRGDREESCAACFQSDRGRREAWALPESVWRDNDPDVYFAVEEWTRLI